MIDRVPKIQDFMGAGFPTNFTSLGLLVDKLNERGLLFNTAAGGAVAALLSGADTWEKTFAVADIIEQSIFDCHPRQWLLKTMKQEDVVSAAFTSAAESINAGAASFSTIAMAIRRHLFALFEATRPSAGRLDDLSSDDHDDLVAGDDEPARRQSFLAYVGTAASRSFAREHAASDQPRPRTRRDEVAANKARCIERKAIVSRIAPLIEKTVLDDDDHEMYRVLTSRTGGRNEATRPTTS